MEPSADIITAENFKDRFPAISDKEYVGHKKRVYSLNWNCTGTKLGSASADNTIRVIAAFPIVPHYSYGILMEHHLKKVRNSKDILRQWRKSHGILNRTLSSLQSLQTSR